MLSVYAITIIIATKFPQALETRSFTPHTKQKEHGNQLVMKECFEMPKSSFDFYELTADFKLTQKQNTVKESTLFLKYNVSMHSTQNENLWSQCENIDQQMHHEPKTISGDRWNTIVYNQLKNRTLQCNQLSGDTYSCLDVPIAKGDTSDLFDYNQVQVILEQNQQQFSIVEMSFDIKMRNTQHTSSLNNMKYAFVLVTLFAIYLYWKSDLGLIQKWVMVLLVQLLFFDDPLHAVKGIFPYNSYTVVQALAQSTFIAMLLFFWLIVIHSISSVRFIRSNHGQSEVINIDERRFYMPKIVVCLSIWVVLTLSSSYLNIQQSNDPSFYWKDDKSSFYSSLQILSVVMFILYSSYFVIIAYVAFFQISEMKKSYKFSLFLTFAVIFLCISMMILNAYRSQNDSKLCFLTSLAVMFVAFHAMFNIYMYIIAYLYSPSVDSLEDLQFKQTRKEHEHIMNQFYEQELPDISKDIDTSRDNLSGDRQSLNRKSNVGQRRHLKKDPQQKAKDKLWESIIKETEEEDDDSSDDEHQI